VNLADRIGDGSHFVDRRIIRAFSEPVSPVGGLVALFGSLAPDGAILKRSAATPTLFETEARCMVFDGLEDLANRIDDPALDVTAQDILVLKNAGPRSPSGMPEAGYLPIPKKLARAGVKDMVRMSDCRMSGKPVIASGFRSRTASLICWWRKMNWPAAALPGNPPRPPSAAGTSLSMIR